MTAVPAGAAPLALGDAVKLAVDRNVSVRVARARDEAARARALAAAAQLLPSVTGTMSEQRVFRLNLASLGFTSGPFPILLGPFDVFDARFRLAMSVLDIPSWSRWSAARKRGQAAQAEQDLASEQVAAAAALAYVEALRAREAIRAAQAGVALANELVRLATDRRATGTAMGLDVARAQTQLAEENLRLLDARTDAREADLRLKRVAGLPLGEPVELSETLVSKSTAVPALEDTLALAESQRLELSIARERLEAEGLMVRAARSERLPKITAAADGGLSGVLPDRSARATGSIGAALAVPIFDWGVSARTGEAKAAQEEAQARYDDLALAVEEDARRATDRMEEAAERVATSQLAAQFARHELELARGRFEAGVGDNLELVNAQTETARADDRLAAALAAFQTARINRALAVGRMREFTY